MSDRGDFFEEIQTWRARQPCSRRCSLFDRVFVALLPTDQISCSLGVSLGFSPNLTTSLEEEEEEEEEEEKEEEEEEEEFCKLRPANKTDHLCQSWQ